MSEKHPLTDPLLKENPLTLTVLGVCAALQATAAQVGSIAELARARLLSIASSRERGNGCPRRA